MENIKNWKTFNESYCGIIKVVFNNPIKISSNWDGSKGMFITLNKDLFSIDFSSFKNERQIKENKKVSKFLSENNFDTKFDEKNLILSGKYEVYDVKNGVKELIQYSENNSVKFLISEFYVRKGDVEYSDDLPN